jgi:hypothetical protein
MKTFFLSILLLAGFSVTRGQTGCTVKKAHAWYNVSMPGNIMTDENGNPVQPTPNITRFIYIEYSGTKPPEIRSIRYDSTVLDFSVERIKEKTVSIGDMKFNPGKTISVKKGNSFVKINLHPFEGKSMPAPDCRHITINYTMAKKLCKFNITGEKQFATLPGY